MTQEIYRGENKGLHVLLSRTQAGPGRTVKQKQEEISRNHLQTFIFPSVHVNNFGKQCISMLHIKGEVGKHIHNFYGRPTWKSPKGGKKPVCKYEFFAPLKEHSYSRSPCRLVTTKKGSSQENEFKLRVKCVFPSFSLNASLIKGVG